MSDTPTDRAALEALAREQEAIAPVLRAREAIHRIDVAMRPDLHISYDADVLGNAADFAERSAATLRALAAQAERADTALEALSTSLIWDKKRPAWCASLRGVAGSVPCIGRTKEAVCQPEHEALVIDVEGADQDGPMVGWEYTATGMRFTIRGALAKALNAKNAPTTEE